MRIGQNPAKFVESVPSPARVTVAIITYVPFVSGYYAQMLDVIKTSLDSLRAHTQIDYDLLVFDNGSCAEMRDYLQSEQDAGRIDYLTLSQENLGKAAAWNFIFAAAPGEIIAYADADIYYEQGWLGALVNVLDAFPRAGMVTGIPMWSPEPFSTATIEWAEASDEVQLERGKLLPWNDYWKHARSLGQDEATAKDNFAKQEDIRIRLNVQRSTFNAPAEMATTFYVGAGHFQFIARKAVLQEVIPIPADRPMGQVRRLDAAINNKGYLRLSTPDWWVHHMGNVVPESTVIGNQPQAAPKQPVRGPLRRIVQWVYHRSFELLYGGKR
jgi:hypothetical protein